VTAVSPWVSSGAAGTVWTRPLVQADAVRALGELFAVTRDDALKACRAARDHGTYEAAGDRFSVDYAASHGHRRFIILWDEPEGTRGESR